MIAESFVGCNDTCLIRPPDALRTGAKRSSVGNVIGRYKIVHTVYFIHVMAFAYRASLGNYDTFSLFDWAAHVRFKFGALHLSVAVYSVNLSIVVKQHTQVVDASLHVYMLPRAFDFFAHIALKPFTVDIAVEIEFSVMVSDTWSPNALTINFLTVLKRESVIVKIKTVKTVRHIFPVDQIL